ncbi:MAG: hypothetical protein K9L85_02320 [Candidatus Peribacteraceae bacterium]|nr:hypothetical protein [Candidatus Peribacteraceae bacterium]
MSETSNSPKRDDLPAVVSDSQGNPVEVRNDEDLAEKVLAGECGIEELSPRSRDRLLAYLDNRLRANDEQVPRETRELFVTLWLPKVFENYDSVFKRLCFLSIQKDSDKLELVKALLALRKVFMQLSSLINEYGLDQSKSPYKYFLSLKSAAAELQTNISFDKSNFEDLQAYLSRLPRPIEDLKIRLDLKGRIRSRRREIKAKTESKAA